MDPPGGIKRGHLEVSVTYQNNRADSKTVAIDRELVELACAQETADRLPAVNRKPRRYSN